VACHYLLHFAGCRFWNLNYSSIPHAPKNRVATIISNVFSSLALVGFFRVPYSESGAVTSIRLRRVGGPASALFEN